MSEPQANVSKRRRFSPVWIVPIVAVALGLWVMVDLYSKQGPVVQIKFITAAGIEVDKTRVKTRDVEIGVVTAVDLNEDFTGVTVTAELNVGAAALLREDTQFWVVRPRVGAGGISGLSTIVSGAYIEVAPGVGAPRQSHTFTGLEQEPITAVGTPGMRIRFVSATSGSVGVGDPLLYRGFRVGRVEESRLDLENREVRYTAFITDPYDQLVTTNTRFWNVSGVSAELSAEGFKLGIASFQTLLAGGVAFGPGEGSAPGDPVPNDHVFKLFADETSAYEDPHRFYKDYVASFMQPMGGLKPGAPVTFRGIRIGTVLRILVSESFEASAPGVNRPMPVLIRVQPGRITDDTQQSMDRLNESLDRAVKNGLRATLASGNLLTGSQLINLDYVENAPPATVSEYQGYPTLPTVPGGLARLTDQVSDLLDKVNALPLEEMVSTANETITELQHALQDVRALLASDGIQNLPARLDAALLQLNYALANFSEESGFSERLARLMIEATTTLKSVQDVAESLEQNPNALIFPTRLPPDPQPKASP